LRESLKNRNKPKVEERKKVLTFTVEVYFELLEGIGSVVGAESDGDGVFAESVDEPLGKHLLVGLPDPDLHLLQVQQLLEDFSLQIVPAIFKF
jgi:hypothetical protein